jgi:hypothetical protein
MAIPKTGSYEMFTTGSTKTIAGGIKEGSAAASDGAINFSNLITTSSLDYFDKVYSGEIRSLSDVSTSLQYRNYPVIQCLAKASFTEKFYPSNVQTQFAVYLVNENATGSVEVNTTASDSILSISATSGSIVGATASAGTNTTFLGWSLSEGTENILQTGAELSVTASLPTTYYALMENDTHRERFCFFNSSSNVSDICLTCNNQQFVYFNTAEYKASGSAHIIWYSDENLTTRVEDGIYRKNIDRNTAPLFHLISGSVDFYKMCDSSIMYCDITSSAALCTNNSNLSTPADLVRFFGFLEGTEDDYYYYLARNSTDNYHKIKVKILKTASNVDIWDYIKIEGSNCCFQLIDYADSGYAFNVQYSGSGVETC